MDRELTKFVLFIVWTGLMLFGEYKLRDKKAESEIGTFWVWIIGVFILGNI